MIVKDIASNSLPFLKLSDKGEFAIEAMIHNKVFDLPVIDEVKFLGSITAEEILQQKGRRKSLSEMSDHFLHYSILESAPLHQAVGLLSQYHLSMLPVVNEEGELVSTLSTHDLFGHFTLMSGMNHPGGTLMLEIPSYSYSLAEIARLAESNNAHILASYIQQQVDSQEILVYLKFNLTDLNSIVATYERFGYTVLAHFHEADFDFYQERYQALMNYLSL